MTLYLIKSCLCLLAFHFFYCRVLAKEKMFVFNRFFLLGSLLFAHIVPLLQFEFSIGFQRYGLDPLGLLERSIDSSPLALELVNRILIATYISGSVLLGIRFIRNFVSLKTKMHIHPSRNFQGTQLILVPEKILPYTFLNRIFLNQEQYENNRIEREVLTHELAHAKQMVFDNSLNSKIIATTLSLASEIERTFISMRTKEALKKAKENGKTLGRPKGKKSVNAKLAANHDEIEKLLKDRVSASAIGRMMKVDRKTVGRYIERRLPQYSKKKK